MAGSVVVATLATLAHERLKTFDSSYALWNDAVKLTERNDARTPMLARQYTSRGLASLVARQPQYALSDFDRALTFSHRYILAIHGKGLALMQLGRYADAKTSFDQALMIKPDFIPSMLARSGACSKLGDSVCANNDLKKACDLGAPLACYFLEKKIHPENKEFIIRVK